MVKAGLAAVLTAGALLAAAAPASAQYYGGPRYQDYDRGYRPPPPRPDFGYGYGPGRCLARVTGVGKASNDPFSSGDRQRAIARAVESWSENVAIAYGPRFANWDFASGKSQSCSGSGFRIRCTVSARPCG
jgi:hypothetical protein